MKLNYQHILPTVGFGIGLFFVYNISNLDVSHIVQNKKRLNEVSVEQMREQVLAGDFSSLPSTSAGSFCEGVTYNVMDFDYSGKPNLIYVFEKREKEIDYIGLFSKIDDNKKKFLGGISKSFFSEVESEIPRSNKESLERRMARAKNCYDSDNLDLVERVLKRVSLSKGAIEFFKE